MTTDLAELLGTQETSALEFKRSAKRPQAVRRAICALANDLGEHGGGDLLIGVADNGEPVEDVDRSDRALLALTDMREDGLLLDRPSMTVSVVPFKGKPVTGSGSKRPLLLLSASTGWSGSGRGLRRVGPHGTTSGC